MFTKGALFAELMKLQRFDRGKKDMDEDEDGEYVAYYDLLAMFEKLLKS